MAAPASYPAGPAAACAEVEASAFIVCFKDGLVFPTRFLERKRKYESFQKGELAEQLVYS
jgi:hypothetical protein